MSNRARWASQPRPMTPKAMGARMKKMHEQRRMAKGRAVAPDFDPDVPDWARPPPALEGFNTTFVPLDEQPYRIGWLARFFQYVRNEFSQFVSVVSGYSPFQYYAGPYSPWDKAVSYVCSSYGSGGWAPASLTFSLAREYICTSGSFSIGHEFSWKDSNREQQDSCYSLSMQLFTEDFFMQSVWEGTGNMNFAFRPSELGPEWLDRVDASVSCQYNSQMDKFHWGIVGEYRGDYSHWTFRYAPQMLSVNFYAGLLRGLSAGMEYTYHHKFGVSAWGASGYYEYATDPEDEDSHGPHGWGFAIELNPQGGFHTTLAMDRGISIPGQPIYMAAAYSFTYGGDDIVTAWYAGFRTTVPLWFSHWIPIKTNNSDEFPREDELADLRHDISRVNEHSVSVESEPYEEGDKTPTQAVIGWSTSSDGFYGWTMQFDLFNFGDDSDEPHYPVNVSAALDVGLLSQMISPILTISSSY